MLVIELASVSERSELPTRQLLTSLNCLSAPLCLTLPQPGRPVRPVQPGVPPDRLSSRVAKVSYRELEKENTQRRLTANGQCERPRLSYLPATPAERSYVWKQGKGNARTCPRG